MLGCYGAGGGTRTHTMSPSADFESATSTNSITPADGTCLLYKTLGQNSRGDFPVSIKNEQTVKSAENPKKSYPNTGGCAMIVSVKLCAFDREGGE